MSLVSWIVGVLHQTKDEQPVATLPKTISTPAHYLNHSVRVSIGQASENQPQGTSKVGRFPILRSLQQTKQEMSSEIHIENVLPGNNSNRSSRHRLIKQMCMQLRAQ